MPEQGGGGADRDPRGRDDAAGLSLWFAVLLTLAGAVLLLVAYEETWLCGGPGLADPRGGGTETPIRICHDGPEVVRGLAGLAAASLGGLLAVAATRGTGRLVAGAGMTLLGLAQTALVAGFLLDPVGTFRGRLGLPGSAYAADVEGGARFALAAALAVTAGGVLVAAYGRRWPVLGGRYERRPADPAAAMWEELDRGVDPTA